MKGRWAGSSQWFSWFALSRMEPLAYKQAGAGAFSALIVMILLER